MNKNIINLLLDLFDGGAGAGADSSGAGAAGDSNNGETQALSSPAVKRKTAENPLNSVQYGKQPQAETSAIENEEPPQKSPQERAAEFEKLIKGDYKDLFQQKMQSVIDKRFAETKSLQAAADKTAPLINKLMERYAAILTEQTAKI